MKCDNPEIRKYFWWVIALTAALRLAGVCRPLLGNFSSVQVIYAMMARNFIDFSWNPLLPRLDILWGSEPSVRLLDFPLFSYAVAVLSNWTSLPIDCAGRALSAFFSVASLFVLFSLIRKLWNEKAALACAFFYAFSPVCMIYGQSFQTDSAAAFFAIAALERLAGGIHRPARFLTSIVCFTVVLILRIQYVFLFPVILMVILHDSSSKFGRRVICALIFGLLSLLPLFAWNVYIYFAVLANPDRVIMSIYHQLNTGTFIDYKPWSSFFVSGALQIFLRLVLNPVGALLCLCGICSRPVWKRESVMRVWFVSMLVMLAVLTKKAIDMNYYWMVLVVPASFFAAKALRMFKDEARSAVRFLAGLLFAVVSLGFAFGSAYGTPAQDRSVMAAADYVRAHSEKGDRVIASNGTNLNLLYYCGRRGWNFPISDRANTVSAYTTFTLGGRPLSSEQQERIDSQKDAVSAIEYYLKQGARYFVCSRLTDFDAAGDLRQYLDSRHTLVIRTQSFVVYRLKS